MHKNSKIKPDRLAFDPVTDKTVLCRLAALKAMSVKDLEPVVLIRFHILRL